MSISVSSHREACSDHLIETITPLPPHNPKLHNLYVSWSALRLLHQTLLSEDRPGILLMDHLCVVHRPQAFL